ncbi:DNA polymerase III subunit gamma/tau [Mesonia sp. K7]|uniref:DNA polymerase III subunit gamma/tau n=1 Tax=Mesonia sp. K7 TaxID=2218606 RepID=UPI000DAAB1CF|nr:DNA polymerase III subunit gamma/tau [Mesonia sp. K7]PZD79232.1 DNA polymerase III subunit gamma/tau [Mesonia sp. K7]
MEHFIVSARKYRPNTFEDVVGQQAITKTLENAIKNNHLAQALLFTGPRGVGKTTCARILAKKINQEALEEKTDSDFAFNIFELDAASNNSVDDIRNLIDQVRIPPQTGKYKVYIIDEVHMLSSAAFNAFLKTLEEPPKHAIFILATTEKHKIIPTILSRCQIFDFKRIRVADAKAYLARIAENEGVQAEDDALHIIAQKADGAMRDALSIYDRVISYSGKKLTKEAVAENLNVLDYDVYFTSTAYMLENKIPELLLYFNEILGKGFDGQHYIAGLASHFRDLWVCKNQSTISLLEVGEQTKAKYFEQSQKTDEAFLTEALKLANDCDLRYKTSHNQRLLVELCLMQLASITYDGEKKKDKPFLIPASFYHKKSVATTPQVNQSKVLEKIPELVSEKQETYDTPDKNSATTENIKTSTIDKVGMQKPSSGLSLKSIARKKELTQKLNEQKAREIEVKLDSDFSENDMQLAWNDYVKILKKNGEKILASILETDTPKLHDKTIQIVLPNSTMKSELSMAKNKLIKFLRKKLLNSYIELKIVVNEETSKKYAFTSREKYEKLKEKNPLLDKLRKTFDLDIK